MLPNGSPGVKPQVVVATVGDVKVAGAVDRHALRIVDS
jgi:hypothetical protein